VQQEVLFCMEAVILYRNNFVIGLNEYSVFMSAKISYIYHIVKNMDENISGFSEQTVFWGYNAMLDTR